MTLFLCLKKGIEVWKSNICPNKSVIFSARITNCLSALLLLALLNACNNQAIDIEKERQNAVDEYKAQMETERKQKLSSIEKFYGVFATGDMSVLPEIYKRGTHSQNCAGAI
ncbi:MAG: hypothetical protein AAFZ15_26520 [Bacteroidota bacterium]